MSVRIYGYYRTFNDTPIGKTVSERSWAEETDAKPPARMVETALVSENDYQTLKVNAESVVGSVEHYFRFPTETNRLTMLQCIEAYKER